jgi:hypothetical protein
MILLMLPDGSELANSHIDPPLHGSSVVPSLLVEQSESVRRQHLTMPDFRLTLVDEAHAELLYSMAFPTLFPMEKLTSPIPAAQLLYKNGLIT